jgi:hypothetical protein
MVSTDEQGFKTCPPYLATQGRDPGLWTIMLGGFPTTDKHHLLEALDCASLKHLE